MATRTPPRRPSGFSEDGLSYSVASDFDKLIGQAMAEADARRADPRFVAGARVEEPDSEARLQAELIDPVLRSFGFPTQTPQQARATQPKTFEIGNQLVQVDPLGQTKVLHTAPQKATPEERYTIPTGVDVFGKPSTTANLTLNEISEMAPTLPDVLRTNAPVSTYVDWAKRAKGGNLPTSAVAPGARGEVTKKLKNGRQAVFDSDTKEFIRYAD